MNKTVLRASYSAGQDALENFDTLAAYAASGAKKTKRRVLQSGHNVTVIKDGYVVEVMPNGEESVRHVVNTGTFRPLLVGE